MRQTPLEYGSHLIQNVPFVAFFQAALVPTFTWIPDRGQRFRKICLGGILFSGAGHVVSSDRHERARQVPWAFSRIRAVSRVSRRHPPFLAGGSGRSSHGRLRKRGYHWTPSRQIFRNRSLLWGLANAGVEVPAASRGNREDKWGGSRAYHERTREWR